MTWILPETGGDGAGGRARRSQRPGVAGVPVPEKPKTRRAASGLGARKGRRSRVPGEVDARRVSGRPAACSYLFAMVTDPFVVIARTVAPPPFNGTDNRRLIRPWTVIGISVLIRPFTVPVSSSAA
jgi:hypothetical protein